MEGIANCTDLEVCLNTIGSYECINQEDLFEQHDPDRIVLASRYSMDADSRVYVNERVSY